MKANENSGNGSAVGPQRPSGLGSLLGRFAQVCGECVSKEALYDSLQMFLTEQSQDPRLIERALDNFHRIFQVSERPEKRRQGQAIVKKVYYSISLRPNWQRVISGFVGNSTSVPGTQAAIAMGGLRATTGGDQPSQQRASA